VQSKEDGPLGPEKLPQLSESYRRKKTSMQKVFTSKGKRSQRERKLQDGEVHLKEGYSTSEEGLWEKTQTEAYSGWFWERNKESQAGRTDPVKREMERGWAREAYRIKKITETSESARHADCIERSEDYPEKGGNV